MVQKSCFPLAVKWFYAIPLTCYYAPSNKILKIRTLLIEKTSPLPSKSTYSILCLLLPYTINYPSFTQSHCFPFNCSFSACWSLFHLEKKNPLLIPHPSLATTTSAFSVKFLESSSIYIVSSFPHHYHPVPFTPLSFLSLHYTIASLLEVANHLRVATFWSFSCIWLLPLSLASVKLHS